MISIIRTYEMEVAHRLTAGVPEGHRCRRPHGHRYVMQIEIAGDVAPTGILVEYGDIDRIVKPIIGLVDHNDLNTLNERCSTPLAALVARNPTVERLVEWFAARLKLLASASPEMNTKLVKITIQEDSRSAVKWRP